ncbi:MAG: hypothetical protein H7288_23375 [Kineosporiaceae bacterium]|nr:hypothetical protein [Aeromicrobium sp.]
MAIVWGIIAIGGAAFLLQLVLEPRRRRREHLILAFTDRIDLPVTAAVVDVIDRRIRNRSIRQAMGGLITVVIFAVVVLVAPGLVPVGIAGFATTGILVAGVAAGGAVSAARQFPAPAGSDATRVARLDTHTLGDYVHPAWVWAAAIGAGTAAALSAGLLSGAIPGDADAAGIPIHGVAVLAAFSVAGVAGAALITRRLLAIPQLASDEVELEWDDALRAHALRDVWIASIGLSAAAVVSGFSWMFNAASPGLYVGILIGIAPLLLLEFRASTRSSRRLWRRSGVVN